MLNKQVFYTLYNNNIHLYLLLLLLLLLLKDNPSFNEVGVGAPLRPNVSKDNVSITPVGDLLLGGCRLCMYPKDNIYIDMQAGINLEVLRKCANSTISVVRMAFYPLDCC